MSKMNYASSKEYILFTVPSLHLLYSPAPSIIIIIIITKNLSKTIFVGVEKNGEKFAVR